MPKGKSKPVAPMKKDMPMKKPMGLAIIITPKPKSKKK